MSRELFPITHDYSVQANFTAWCNGVHQAILNRGWLQTADTGQIDPATVTQPGSGTYAGYVIYKTNDGIGQQFFLKLQYGRSTSTRHPKYQFSLGTGSNGTGTLTGNLSAVFDLWPPLNDDGGETRRALVAGTAGRLMVTTNVEHTNPAAFTAFFVIARTVDAAGAANANGMQYYLQGSQTVLGQLQGFVPAPAYSSIVEPETYPMGASPMGDIAANRWRKGAKSFFSHPSCVHDVDSQYPNPYMAITDNGNSTPAFTVGGMYRLTSYGTTRNYWITNVQLGAGALNGAAWAPCIE